MSIFDAIENKSLKSIILSKEEKLFNSQDKIENFIVNVTQIFHFKAINIKDEKALLIFSKSYMFKNNDKIIDERNINYFVKDVDSFFGQTFILNDSEKFELTVQKVFYNDKPLELPSYLKQELNIKNEINIDAKNSSFRDVGNITANQNLDYKLLYKELTNYSESCYGVEELRKMLKEIKTSIDKKEEIKEGGFIKFIKFLGSQGVTLLSAFVVAYNLAKAAGLLP